MSDAESLNSKFEAWAKGDDPDLNLFIPKGVAEYASYDTQLALKSWKAALASVTPAYINSDGETYEKGDTLIKPSHVEYQLKWDEKNPDGSRKYPNQPEVEECFDTKRALAILLAEDIIFLNNHWWEKTWPEECRDLTSLNVNTNDIFDWGCADAESIKYKEIETVYKYWKKDSYLGTAVWAIIKNRQMPQHPVEQIIREKGIWDLDALQKEYNLRPNYYDGVSKILAKKKYSTYSTWAKLNNMTVLVFDKNWWDGWGEFVAANPNWYSEEWKAEEEKAIADFKKEHGYA